MASASSGMATVAGSHDLAGRLLNNIAGSGTAMGSGSTSTVTRLLSSSEAHTQQQGSSQMMAIPYGDSSTAHYISHQNGAQSDVPVSTPDAHAPCALAPCKVLQNVVSVNGYDDSMIF